MIAMTTSNSMSVKPERRRRRMGSPSNVKMPINPRILMITSSLDRGRGAPLREESEAPLRIGIGAVETGRTGRDRQRLGGPWALDRSRSLIARGSAGLSRGMEDGGGEAGGALEGAFGDPGGRVGAIDRQ